MSRNELTRGVGEERKIPGQRTEYVNAWKEDRTRNLGNLKQFSSAEN